MVLEGIDGAGKSEQVARLAKWLVERGVEVVATREPTDGHWGRRYRAWARGEFEAGADEVLEMFVRDREEHLAQVVEPALARGAFVICDRYVASTRAYQAASGLDRELLRQTLEHFREPDLVLWLRLPVPSALARLGESAVERYENGEFLERVDREYASFGLVEVDASGSPDQVEARLRDELAPLLR